MQKFRLFRGLLGRLWSLNMFTYYVSNILNNITHSKRKVIQFNVELLRCSILLIEKSGIYDVHIENPVEKNEQKFGQISNIQPGIGLSNSKLPPIGLIFCTVVSWSIIFNFRCFHISAA
jgi:hypothetical protein